MATIKSFTSVEQSKKLAEILPLESADMFYMFESINKEPYYHPIIITEHSNRNFIIYEHNRGKGVVSWSLAALLDVLPNNKHITTTLSRGGWKIEPVEYIDKWFCEYEEEVDEDSPYRGFTVSAENPVDACVAMIERLHELKML